MEALNELLQKLLKTPMIFYRFLNTSLWMRLLLVSLLKNGFYQSGFTGSLPKIFEELFQRTIVVTKTSQSMIHTKSNRVCKH